jgi:hypothetical protein
MLEQILGYFPEIFPATGYNLDLASADAIGLLEVEDGFACLLGDGDQTGVVADQGETMVVLLERDARWPRLLLQPAYA